jgi:hypothetical protein
MIIKTKREMATNTTKNSNPKVDTGKKKLSPPPLKNINQPLNSTKSNKYQK